MQFSAAPVDAFRRDPAYVERTRLDNLCAKYQPNRLSRSREYSTKRIPAFYIQGLLSLNVGTSHSYRGPQMEQLLPLPLFLIRP